MKNPRPCPFLRSGYLALTPTLGSMIYSCILTSNRFLFSLFELISVTCKQESKLIQWGSILEGRGKGEIITWYLWGQK